MLSIRVIAPISGRSCEVSDPQGCRRRIRGGTSIETARTIPVEKDAVDTQGIGTSQENVGISLQKLTAQDCPSLDRTTFFQRTARFGSWRSPPARTPSRGPARHPGAPIILPRAGRLAMPKQPAEFSAARLAFPDGAPR